MKNPQLSNNWFSQLSFLDVINFYRKHFNAKIEIKDMQINQSSTIFEVHCKNTTTGEKTIVFMGEYGFYDLNEYNEFVFNSIFADCKYKTQTMDLVNLLKEKNKNTLLKDRTYPEAFMEYHTMQANMLKKRDFKNPIDTQINIVEPEI